MKKSLGTNRVLSSILTLFVISIMLSSISAQGVLAQTIESPNISNVSHDPEIPNCSQNEVTVTAQITDSNPNATIAFAELNYRFNGKVIDFPMILNSDELYEGTAFVPDEALIDGDGLTVVYGITAENNFGQTTNTGLIFDYTYDCGAPTADPNGPYFRNEGETFILDGSGSFDSVSGISEYQWDFGDGTQQTTTEPTIEHTYQDNGDYIVTLIVVDGVGNPSSPTTTTANIENLAPVANANGPYECNEGDVITLDGSATDAGALDSHTFAWDLDEDGIFETPGEDVLFNCVDDDVNTATLRVTDNDGASDEDSATVTIINVNPTVDANGPYECNEGETRLLDGSGSDILDDTLTFAWDLDEDGIFETPGEDVQFSCVDDGVYNVKLMVSDEDGGSNMDSSTVTVGNVAPTIFTIFAPIEGFEGEEIILPSPAVTFTDAGVLDTHTASIDWDDTGINENCIVSYVDSEGHVDCPSHIYEENSVYDVVISILDDDGSRSSISSTIVINNKPPVANANGPYECNEGVACQFAGTFTDAGSLDSHTFLWSFGDGETSTEQNPVHTYARQSEYLVTFTVTDDDDGFHTDETTANVADSVPTASFIQSLTEPSEGEEIQFTDTSTSPVDEIVSWLWDFGDGTTSNLQNPTHTYLEDGSYTVTLTVTDLDGSVDSASGEKIVSNIAPVVDAGADLITDEGAAISVSGTFTDDGVLDTHTAFIEWGDEAIDNCSVTEANGAGTFDCPEHTYIDNGEFTATVTVTDDENDSGSDELTITVNNVAPVVDAGADQLISLNEQPVVFATFSDAGILDTHTATINWGDGTVEAAVVDQDADSVSGSHTYTNTGTFNVVVTLEDNDGSSGSDTLNVQVSDLVLEFIADWNLFSVPKVLVDSDVGDVLEGLDFSIVLTYENGQWIQPDTIEPLRAYWINMNQAGELDLTYRTEPCDDDTCIVPGSRDLNADWELIGYTGTEPMPSELALKSIEGSYSQWFGFVEGTWISHIFGQVPDIDMEPGLGYWVFMTEPATIAVISL